ncbi:QWRF motif-containing protein 3 isoform X1 [Cicer arietinum]|uniref:QWRF motif-containing protein 3 isoform X1 n=1 Tax=Cicer arietinum TaxID=3827 RepID=UPI00032A7424
MKTQNDSPKLRHHTNRQLISRLLPSPNSSSIDSTEFPSPSSVIRKSSSTPSDINNRRHKINDDSLFNRYQQLWPSTAKINNNSGGTLADQINEDRIIEQNSKHKQKSNRECKYFELHDEIRETGGSARFTGKSMKKLNFNGSVIVPGRFSLDENAKPFLKRNSSLTSSIDIESRCSDEGLVSPARKSVVEVPSRFMSDATIRRARRGASDTNIGNLNGGDLSKPVIKRTNSVAGYKSSKTQWALSPGRSEFLSSPTKVKRVEKFLNFGFDLFKSKKSVVLNSLPVAFGNNEDVYKLRLLHNRLIQWRFVNARSHVVNANISPHAQSNLICVWDGLTKLRYSVMKKKIQYAREKLEMKIAFMLYYQLKLLEAWGGMERQHISTINATKECLHSAVCRVPLLEGAKVNIQFTSIAIRQASELTASIKSLLTSFSHAQVDKTVAMVSELAKVVAQEKQLLEEFYDLLQTTSLFELQERSVNCSLIQFEGWQRKYQLQQLLP